MGISTPITLRYATCRESSSGTVRESSLANAEGNISRLQRLICLLIRQINFILNGRLARSISAIISRIRMFRFRSSSSKPVRDKFQRLFCRKANCPLDPGYGSWYLLMGYASGSRPSAFSRIILIQQFFIDTIQFLTRQRGQQLPAKVKAFIDSAVFIRSLRYKLLLKQLCQTQDISCRWGKAPPHR